MHKLTSIVRQSWVELVAFLTAVGCLLWIVQSPEIGLSRYNDIQYEAIQSVVLQRFIVLIYGHAAILLANAAILIFNYDSIKSSPRVFLRTFLILYTLVWICYLISFSQASSSYFVDVVK